MGEYSGLLTKQHISFDKINEREIYSLDSFWDKLDVEALKMIIDNRSIMLFTKIRGKILRE